MTLKEAIESGKPFRRESWVMLPHQQVWWTRSDINAIIGNSSTTAENVCATDWILKYDCETCKDTKKSLGFPKDQPCPDCSAPPKMKKIKVYRPVTRGHDGLYYTTQPYYPSKFHPLIQIDIKDIVGWKEEEIEVLDQ